jgi:selenoprotein W-related protein
VLQRWAPVIKGIQLIPSSGGRFEVVLDGELIFSKASLKRHAEPGEVVSLVEKRLGPPLPRD